ncbi:hypothetical protein T484DRAFT_1902286, partial [Baffinella frigidus]
MSRHRPPFLDQRGTPGQAYGWEVKEEAQSPYTPRRSARFDHQEVLGALMSAPPLPSPALTPRMLDLSQNAYPADRLDSSRSYLPPPITPRSGMYGFGAHPHGERGSPDRMERSSWLPSPRPSLGGSLKGAHYEASLDGSILSRQVLDTQQPEFISKLETSLMDHIRTGRRWRRTCTAAWPSRLPRIWTAKRFGKRWCCGRVRTTRRSTPLCTRTSDTRSTRGASKPSRPYSRRRAGGGGGGRVPFS